MKDYAAMNVEEISTDNIHELTTLVLELWTDCNYDEEYQNCHRILQSETETCYLVEKQGFCFAFIYLALRSDYVEGAISSPVVYIEGLYVRPEYRARGVGRKLVNLGEQWARQKGCKQYASDAELDNHESISFHKKVGFQEVNRTVSFIKRLE